MFFLATSFQTLNRSTNNEDTAKERLSVGYYSPEKDVQPGCLTIHLQSGFAKAGGQQESDGASQQQRVSKKIRIPNKARGTSTKRNIAFFDIALVDPPHRRCCLNPECAAGGKTLRFCSGECYNAS